jgi:hypothetical protein
MARFRAIPSFSRCSEETIANAGYNDSTSVGSHRTVGLALGRSVASAQHAVRRLLGLEHGVRAELEHDPPR